MVKITVELVSARGREHDKVLGVGYISNDATGEDSLGHYNVKLMRADNRGSWREGRVENFPRLRLGCWDLLFRALRETIGDRNRG